jgi:hypothetical protein
MLMILGAVWANQVDRSQIAPYFVPRMGRLIGIESPSLCKWPSKVCFLQR